MRREEETVTTNTWVVVEFLQLHLEDEDFNKRFRKEAMVALPGRATTKAIDHEALRILRELAA